MSKKEKTLEKELAKYLKEIEDYRTDIKYFYEIIDKNIEEYGKALVIAGWTDIPYHTAGGTHGVYFFHQDLKEEAESHKARVNQKGPSQYIALHALEIWVSTLKKDQLKNLIVWQGKMNA